MKPVCHLQKKLRDESGNVLVFVALCMTVLMGFMALAIDVGLMFRDRRNMQIAADAAATAGALDYFHNSSTLSARTVATAAATANGYTTGTNGAIVTPNSPAIDGVHTGTGSVEVQISQPSPTFFMKVFGFNSMTVGVRAVAGQIPGPCIYLGSGGLNVQGNATIEGIDPTTGAVERGCGIYSKGNSSATGNSNKIDMAYVVTSGTASGSFNTGSGPLVQNAPAENIPPQLQITAPAPSSFGSCGLPTTGCSGPDHKGVNSCTITSMNANTCYGIYGVTDGTTALNLTLGPGTTLSAGMYGFHLGTGGTLTIADNVTGTGITLDVYTGNVGVTPSSHSTATLSAEPPSTSVAVGTTLADGAVDGVILLEPPTNTGTISIQWGSSTGQFIGIIDAPGATGTLNDNGGSALVTGLVLGGLTEKTSTLMVKSYSAVYGGATFSTVALVE